MIDPVRPLRSVLYVPADRPDAIRKARDLPCDGLVLDLEDAVAPDARIAARERAGAALDAGGFGARLVLVRVNGLDTEWGADDLQALADRRPDGIVLPKVDGPRDVAAAAACLPGGAPLWAMIETARGVAHAVDIAATPGLAGLILGTNDLARDLRCRVGADRASLTTALQATLIAARAARLPCLDGVFGAFRDAEGLRAECVQGRDLGMDGKTLIHPSQIAVANEVFAPDADEVTQARRVVAAFEAASAEGRGIAVLDGRIVETLHVDIARRTLALSEAIAAREGLG